jgi:hypothetical protein
MMSRARSKAIQGLIAGTLALSSYLPEAEASAEGGAEAFVAALVAEAEGSELEVPDRQSLLARLALSPSRSIRVRVAEAAGALSNDAPAAGLALLRRLSHDTAGKVRAAAARALAQFIEHAPGPLRCAVESDWATAEAAAERVALARALGMSAPDWLTDLALLELATDARVAVRRAALQAARSQLDRNPHSYVQVAAAHSGDPDRRVRKTARQVLRQAQAHGRADVTAWLATLQASPSAQRESRRRLRCALHEPRGRGAPGFRTATAMKHVGRPSA